MGLTFTLAVVMGAGASSAMADDVPARVQIETREQLLRLDGSGDLGQVTDLDVLCNECIEALASVRHGKAIQRLRIEGCATDEYLAYHHVACIWISERAARALGRSRALPALTALTITAHGRPLTALLAGRITSSLRRLRVTTDAAGVAALGKASRLGALTHLAIIAHDNKSAAAVRSLVSSRHLRKLDTLRFVSSDSEAEQSLDVDAIRAIATSLRLPALRTLDVSWAYVGDDATAALVAAPWITQLERLGIVYTGAGKRTLEQLAVHGPWTGLSVVWVDSAAARHALPGFAGLLGDPDRWDAEIGTR